MQTKHNVLIAIASERIYQEARKRQKGWKEHHSVGDYLTMLATYLTRAQAAWSDNTGEAAALEVVRKLGAICFACMEENGAPCREMPEDLFPYVAEEFEHGSLEKEKSET